MRRREFLALACGCVATAAGALVLPKPADGWAAVRPDDLRPTVIADMRTQAAVTFIPELWAWEGAHAHSWYDIEELATAVVVVQGDRYAAFMVEDLATVQNAARLRQSYVDKMYYAINRRDLARAA